MNNLLNIQINVPLVPIYKSEKHYLVYAQEANQEFLELDKEFNLQIPEIGEFEISISCPEDVYSDFPRSFIFEINISHNFKSEIIRASKYYESDDEEKLQTFTYQTIEEFKIKIINILVLTNIAKPGAIKTRQGEIITHGEISIDHIVSFPQLYSIHRETLDLVKENKWPILKNLEFEKVFRWFSSNNFSLERCSTNRTERAINAFTYLFRDNLSGLVFDLYWSIVGIEILYCESNGALAEQINSKVPILLGELKEFKNKLKKMYNFRSRLIHGDINIPPQYLVEPDEENFKITFEDDLFNSTVLAVSILTATLQTMVIKNRGFIRFKYELEK